MVKEVFKPSDADLRLVGTRVKISHPARNQAAHQVNSIIVNTYFRIVLKIVEGKQGGASSTSYGRQLLKSLSGYHYAECEKGYSANNLESARRFYMSYKDQLALTSPADLGKIPQQRRGNLLPL